MIFMKVRYESCRDPEVDQEAEDLAEAPTEVAALAEAASAAEALAEDPAVHTVILEDPISVGAGALDAPITEAAVLADCWAC